MPHMVRPVTDERDGLLAFLDKQRDALRAAVHGLTDGQATQVPSASALSLAGLLKHALRTERRWVVVLIGQRELPELWPITDPDADFRLDPGETPAGLLDSYAAVAEETASIVAEVADLGDDLPLPENMRGRDDVGPFSTRWVLLHLIEETARHAGHADIIRESLDGAQAPALMQEFEEAS